MVNQSVTVEEQVVNKVTTFTSKIFTLKTRDLIKGLWTTLWGQVFTVLITSYNDHRMELKWSVLKVTLLSTFLGYLSKNFFEPSKTVAIIDPPVKNIPTEPTTQTITTISENKNPEK